MDKKKRIGTYVLKDYSGESYKTYIPPKLPPLPPIDLKEFLPRLEMATVKLAKLDALAKTIPNKDLFIYMLVRKEALLSSQIEGTQSSFSDLILFEHQLKPNVSLDDVEEVSNYVQAINYALEKIENNFPLSLRLLKETHAVLLKGSRGSKKLPGNFRRSQNWIGGTRPGNALFVPPPVEKLMDCLSNLETFFHEREYPVLIRAALAHVQFETIHPFLDGNGRLGRLLITLMLCEGGVLDTPILYLSLYLKENRLTYYNLLQEVRTQGTWENWLEFFLDGVIFCGQGVIDTTEEINFLFEQDQKEIAKLGRARFSCENVLEFMKRLPQVSVPLLAKELSLSAPAARGAVEHLVKLGILEEITGKKRDRIYVYRRYLDLLETGTRNIAPISTS